MEKASAATILGYIGANVRRLRLRRGLTQEELAERARVSTVHVQRVEAGHANVSVTLLVALGEALGVPPARLLQRAGPIERRPGRPNAKTARRRA
jgi:transcriptional regulator with XRE-family HTH domain